MCVRKRESAVDLPLYEQIAAHLRAEVARGDYSPGARIPSEHELAERFGVGRPTLRQATEVLVREGVLERRKGSGTYVAGRPSEVDLLSAVGTLEPFRRIGLALDTAIVTEPKLIRFEGDAGHPLNKRAVYRIRRQGSIWREPVLLEEMYFDAAIFPNLDRLPLEGVSFSRLAQDHFGTRPARAQQCFVVHALNAKRASYLGLAEGDHVLKVERRIQFHHLGIGFTADMFCRTDSIHFTQSLNLQDCTVDQMRFA